jgi:predicted transcriptional regulator
MKELSNYTCSSCGASAQDRLEAPTGWLRTISRSGATVLHCLHCVSPVPPVPPQRSSSRLKANDRKLEEVYAALVKLGYSTSVIVAKEVGCSPDRARSCMRRLFTAGRARRFEQIGIVHARKRYIYQAVDKLGHPLGGGDLEALMAVRTRKPKVLKATWKALKERGPATAGQLAAHIGVERNSCQTRLSRLVVRGQARVIGCAKPGDTPGPPPYIYEAVAKEQSV